MNLINRLLGRLGYKLIFIGDSAASDRLIIANTFITEADSKRIDEERYKKTQMAGNKAKLHRVWVNPENVKYISDYIRAALKYSPRFGLCHGTRRGVEQAEFSKNLQCEVLGTEISDTARQFADTIQWDFHHVKKEWLGAADFIYSNSLDHSHSPRECLESWVSCLNNDGMLFLEKASDSDAEMVSELDPFGADLDQYVYHLVMWGAGVYYVYDVLKSPIVNPEYRYQYIFVIKRITR